MGKTFFRFRNIILLIVLFWCMSLPCMADEKPTNPPNPIIIEGEIEDDRERSLLFPVEAWKTEKELEVIFHYTISNITLTIYGPIGVVTSRTISSNSNQTEIFDISNYANGTYNIVISTTQGTYLMGTFDVN